MLFLWIAYLRRVFTGCPCSLDMKGAGVKAASRINHPSMCLCLCVKVKVFIRLLLHHVDGTWFAVRAAVTITIIIYMMRVAGELSVGSIHEMSALALMCCVSSVTVSPGGRKGVWRWSGYYIWITLFFDLNNWLSPRRLTDQNKQGFKRDHITILSCHVLSYPVVSFQWANTASCSEPSKI